VWPSYCSINDVEISDWEDCKAKKVVVPAAMLGQTIHHGVSRQVKCISVIVCVSDAGASLIPYIITSQNSPAVQEHLKKQDVRFGRDFTFQVNEEP
jgi:hypothetical protein